MNGQKRAKWGLWLTTAVVLVAALLLSCGQGNANENRSESELDLNAVLFDNAGKWIDLDFQRENVTRGIADVLYLTNGERIKTDASYPDKRIFIVNDQAEFDIIFNEFPPGVNFEKEMILLYGFTTIRAGPYVIKNIKLENERLSIEVKYVDLVVPPGEPHPPDATAPQMRWLVVKTDKLNIETVEFTKT